MNAAVEEEKKPFDSEVAAVEEEAHPDPDEELMLDQGQGKVWMVKIPKFLMERWSAVDEEDVHLASIRIYEGDPNIPAAQRKHKIILFLPPNRDPINLPSSGSFHSLNGTLISGGSNAPSPASAATPPPSAPSPAGPINPNGPISYIHPQITNWPIFTPHPTKDISTRGSDPDIYEIEMVNDNVDNQIVVAERAKDKGYGPPNQPYNPRARMVILTGRIKHECNVRPAFSASYRRQMRERHREYNTPVRTAKHMAITDLQSKRRQTSGFGTKGADTFTRAINPKQKPAKGTYERNTRMPRNELLDHLFAAYKEQPRWTLKALREKTSQPEVWLKENLSDIASLHRSGEFNGLWELKPMFKEANVTAAMVPMREGGYTMEDDEGEDDEDEDMEEVS